VCWNTWPRAPGRPPRTRQSMIGRSSQSGIPDFPPRPAMLATFDLPCIEKSLHQNSIEP
jgi:hypothetical protein